MSALTAKGGTLTFVGGGSSGGDTGSPFVVRDPVTGNLLLNGQRVRFAGANAANDIGLASSGNGNAYGGVAHTTNGYSAYITPHAQVDAYLGAAVLMNANCFKATWSAHTTNHVDSVQPTLGVFNSAALDPLDYALYRAAQLGMKVVVPLAEQYTTKPWYVSQTGGGDSDNFYTRTATINAFKAHISFVLDHVNPYTGLALKDTPAVLCWQIGNEFLAPGITEVQYVTWANSIVDHIKDTKGAQQLVQDGHYGPYGLTSRADIYDQHAYDQYRTVAFLRGEGQTCHAAGKAYCIGEFTWTGKSSSGSNLPWYLDDQLAAFEDEGNIDIDTYWDLLAPLTNWGDGYTLHRPGTTDFMRQRGTLLADHALRMNGITPRVFVSDAFTDTNGTVLSSHGAAGAWVKQDGWTGVSTVAANRLYPGTTEAHYYSSGVPASGDYTVSADIYCASALSGSYAGVLARAYTEQNYSYTAYVWRSGSNVYVYLAYYSVGNYATLAVVGVAPPAVGSTHTLALKVEGSALSLYWDNVLTLGPVTHTSLTAGGRPGIIHGGGGSTSTGFHIDSISAVDL